MIIFNMRVLLSLMVMCFASANLHLNELQVGMPCSSSQGFSVTNFNVVPYPPSTCDPQNVTMQGVFSQNACPNKIFIQENYNHRQTYQQDIDIEGCFAKSQTNTFNFTVTPFQCNSGFYSMQITLTEEPNYIEACWQYQYYI